MEEVVARSSSIPPPLPPKTRNRTQQLSNSSNSSSSSGEILTTFTFPEMRSVNLVSTAQQQQQQQIQEQQQPQGHVVKIRINPEQESVDYTPTDGCIRISVNGTSSHHHHETVIDTSVGGGDDAILRRSTGEKSSATVVTTSTPDRGPGAPYYFYNSFPSASMVISSGQSSPSDTLDSGTCSDLDGSTPPPLPKKTSGSPPPPPRPVAAVVNTSSAPGGSTVVGNTVTVTVNGGVSASTSALTTFHQRNGSLTSSGAEVDSEDEEVDDDRISCDSLNSRELSSLSVIFTTATNDSGIVLSLGASVDKITVNAQDCSPSLTDSGIERDAPPPPVASMPVTTSPPPPPPPPVAEVSPATPTPPAKRQRPEGGCILPQSLLNDIRERSAKLNSVTNGSGIANHGSGSLKKKVTRTWKDATPASSPSTEEEKATVQPKLKPLSIVPIYDDSTPVKKPALGATPEAEVSETDGTPQQVVQPQQQPPPPVPKKPTPSHAQQNGVDQKAAPLTKNVVIVERNSPTSDKKINCVVQERTYEDRKKEWEEKQQQLARQQQLAAIRGSFKYEADRFYNFHLNEHAPDDSVIVPTSPTTPTGRRDSISSNCSSVLLQDDGLPDAEETFAGLKNISASSTIRSAKGTVRGVKNRVRAGIATFLQIQDTKNYKEKEAGKVVVYTTTMGVVRETYQACLKVRNILRTLLVRCEERDVFMSREVQTELRERMRCASVVVPQVFVDGQHLGDDETIERLNESGELRRIMKPFKDPTVCHTCQVCGGFRLLPCSVCNGSKKSMHRNHFTSEFVALKCMHCDEVGLVRCYACS
ncbi:uncharacterized protein LOC126413329 [Schistocerca serialis cubense]|uniref:uncharacterized protein LOC126413329 n=1 Tax=Schistocerca serialis cubense TaxID=2023355 RepID=UPI00214EB805|nr:uncharacterized protein LOC126413329 [Schistocerca serialis cubense]